MRILPPDPGGDARYEYSAKIVCGRQETEAPAQRAPGLYSTSINIHNPGPGAVRFYKKLALTSPPGFQQPGEILPISEDVLDYDEALQTDCRELRKKLIASDEAETIEGFLVIQSPTSLDVTGVYTTAALSADGTVSGHSSIDVEKISERRRATSDILVTKAVEECGDSPSTGTAAPVCDFPFNIGDVLQGVWNLRLFTITVANLGPDPAVDLILDDELVLDILGGDAAGAAIIWAQDPIVLPLGADILTVNQIDTLTSNMRISLPDLPPGETHEIQFWAVSLSFWPANTDPAIQLVDTVEIETATIDTNPGNNTDVAATQLNP